MAATDDPVRAIAQGSALVRAGKYMEAIQPFRLAAASGPDPLGGLLRLCWVYERLDRFDELDEGLARARVLAKSLHVDIAVREAILRSRTEAWRDSLAVLDRAESISGEDRLARGRLRDRAGRFKDAWTDFVRGKSEIARLTNASYPARQIAAHAAQLKCVLTRSWASRVTCAATRSDLAQPVFVCGAPRSGTTLVERILSSDPRVTLRGELPYGLAMAARAATVPGGYPGGLVDLEAPDEAALAKSLRDDYLERASAEGILPPQGKFTDKMPFNEQNLALITMAFPQAPVILVSRHPLDVVVSMMSHHMTHGYNCALSPDTIARHIALVDRLAEHWKDIGLRHHRLRYESLVETPDREIAVLAGATGLSLGDDITSNASVPATPSYAEARDRVHTGAAGRWRNYAPFLAAIGPLLHEMAQRRGYELECV